MTIIRLVQIQCKLTQTVSFYYAPCNTKIYNFLSLVPGEVGNLVCAVSSSSASELSFSWDLPTLLGSEVVSYQVIVNRLEHRPGTREVIQSAVDEQFVDRREASVIGLGKDIVVLKRLCIIITVIKQLLRYPTTSQ